MGGRGGVVAPGEGGRAMTVGNGNGHGRRAEDREDMAARDIAWALFTEAVKTHPTREAFGLALAEYRAELAAAAVRRLGILPRRREIETLRRNGGGDV